MGKQSSPNVAGAQSDGDQIFQLAAELFRVLSAPMRLRIIKSLCEHEKNVSELLSEIDTTQPNMSRYFNTLYFLCPCQASRRCANLLSSRSVAEPVASCANRSP